MATRMNTVAALVLGLAIAALSTPGFARDHDIVVDGVVHISAARAAALRECSARANQYPEYLWGNTELYVYRTCMAEHGQVE